MAFSANIQSATGYTPSHELQFSNFMQTKIFNIRTLREAKDLAILLSEYCANPAMASLGLTEMLVNAIEHGNLNIDYNTKANFKDEQEWFDEINRRLLDKENIHKTVEVRLEVTPTQTKITITDQGNGFDWTKHQDPLQQAQLNKNGRGILMTKELAFDELNYCPPGNKVVCISYKNIADI